MSFRINRVKLDFAVFVKPAMQRLLWNLQHLNADEFTINPYSHKLIHPRGDLLHSWTGLWVDGIRGTAYLLGHILSIAVFLIPIMVVWQ